MPNGAHAASAAHPASPSGACLPAMAVWAFCFLGPLPKSRGNQRLQSSPTLETSTILRGTRGVRNGLGT
jgi:hypothetical protein